MKLFWEQSELESNFTLNSAEKKLITNKTNINKLGFTVLMKYVQYEHRFPKKRKEIPVALIKFISVQLHISADTFKNYKLDLKNSEYKSQRAAIRKFYNIKQ